MSFNEYYFVFLRRNSEYVSKSEERDEEIGLGHFKFIDEMINNGDLFLAAPLDGAGGLYFFDVGEKSKDDIMKLLEKDDSIKEKMFIPEIHKWYVPMNTLQFTYEELKRIKQSKEKKE